jgi:hypothetical protein
MPVKVLADLRRRLDPLPGKTSLWAKIGPNFGTDRGPVS